MNRLHRFIANGGMNRAEHFVGSLVAAHLAFLSHSTAEIGANGFLAAFLAIEFFLDLCEV